MYIFSLNPTIFFTVPNVVSTGGIDPLSDKAFKAEQGTAHTPNGGKTDPLSINPK